MQKMSTRSFQRDSEKYKAALLYLISTYSDSVPEFDARIIAKMLTKASGCDQSLSTIRRVLKSFRENAEKIKNDLATLRANKSAKIEPLIKENAQFMNKVKLEEDAEKYKAALLYLISTYSYSVPEFDTRIIAKMLMKAIGIIIPKSSMVQRVLQSFRENAEKIKKDLATLHANKNAKIEPLMNKNTQRIKVEEFEENTEKYKAALLHLISTYSDSIPEFNTGIIAKMLIKASGLKQSSSTVQRVLRSFRENAEKIKNDLATLRANKEAKIEPLRYQSTRRIKEGKFEKGTERYKAALLCLISTYSDSVPEFDARIIAKMLRKSTRSNPNSCTIERILQSFRENEEKIKNDLATLRENKNAELEPLIKKSTRRIEKGRKRYKAALLYLISTYSNSVPEFDTRIMTKIIKASGCKQSSRMVQRVLRSFRENAEKVKNDLAMLRENKNAEIEPLMNENIRRIKEGKFEEDAEKYKAALLYLIRTYSDSVPEFDVKMIAKMLKEAIGSNQNSKTIQRVLQSFRENADKVKNNLATLRANKEAEIEPLMKKSLEKKKIESLQGKNSEQLIPKSQSPTNERFVEATNTTENPFFKLIPAREESEGILPSIEKESFSEEVTTENENIIEFQSPVNEQFMEITETIDDQVISYYILESGALPSNDKGFFNEDKMTKECQSITGSIPIVTAENISQAAVNSLVVVSPEIQILVQPKIIFRYESEIKGSRWNTLEEKDERKEEVPTVKLNNYSDIAVIRCSLVTCDENNRIPHAHTLAKKIGSKVASEDFYEIEVSSQNEYTAEFHEMRIIPTAKDDIRKEIIRKKKLELLETLTQNKERIRILSEKVKEIEEKATEEAATMNLNSVVLRFQAFHRDKDGVLQKLTDPFYSHVINILGKKRARTSDLCSEQQSQENDYSAIATNVLKKIHAIMEHNPSESKDKIVDLLKEVTKYGDTVLHVALRYNQIEITKAILVIVLGLHEDFKFLVNVKNNSGRTPLHYAVIQDLPDVVQALLILGADPNLCDNENISPLHFAVAFPGRETCVDLILSSNVDLEVPIEEFLHIAAKIGSLEALKLLIKAGADVNCTNTQNGQTVLHIAVEEAHENIVEYLLQETKIDACKRNLDGKTALEIALAMTGSRAQQICELF